MDFDSHLRWFVIEIDNRSAGQDNAYMLFDHFGLNRELSPNYQGEQIKDISAATTTGSSADPSAIFSVLASNPRACHMITFETSPVGPLIGDQFNRGSVDFQRASIDGNVRPIPSPSFSESYYSNQFAADLRTINLEDHVRLDGFAGMKLLVKDGVLLTMTFFLD